MKDLIHTKPINDEEYNEILRQAVSVIESSRVRLAKQINNTVISSYWEIGKLLVECKFDSKYGDSVVEKLSVDLKAKYPEMRLAPRNL